MNGFNPIESREILCIEGQNPLDAVDKHRGDEPCIMHLNSADAIVNQQPAPLLVNRQIVGKEPELGFNLLGSNQCVFRR